MTFGFQIKRENSDYIVASGDGPGPRQVHESMEGERRLIWIPAVPSSGTSCVAGILRALGVDMGITRKETSRGYEMVEDVELSFFTFNQHSELDSLLKQRINFRDYLQFRFFKARDRPTERLGVKALASAWMLDQDPLSLPVDILDVDRPLPEVLMSDQRRVAGAAQRNGTEPLSPYRHIARAGGVAAQWMAKLQLYSMLPPKLSISYESVLRNPEEAVLRIVRAFEIEVETEPWRVAAAVASVSPEIVAKHNDGG